MKWSRLFLDHSFFLNPTQVQLIRGDPRYKLMSPEEVIGKFVSFELMIKGSKQIIERGTTSTPEVQPVAFKATEEKKEESTSSRLPIDASKLVVVKLGVGSSLFSSVALNATGCTSGVEVPSCSMICL